MDRGNDFYPKLAKQVSSDLRLSGYCTIHDNNVDTELLRKYLLSDFKNLLYVEINESRKYFISRNDGKNIVLKLLDSSIYKLKRAIVNLEREFYCMKDYENELERLTGLKSMIEKEKFR